MVTGSGGPPQGGTHPLARLKTQPQARRVGVLGLRRSILLLCRTVLL